MQNEETDSNELKFDGPKLDSTRLRNLSLGLGFFWGLCGMILGIVLLSLIVIVLGSGSLWELNRAQKYVLKLIFSYEGILAVLVSFMLLLVTSVLACRKVLERLEAKGDTHSVSFFYTFLSIFLGLAVGFEGFVIADEGLVDFLDIVLRAWVEQVFLLLAIAFVAAIAAGLFGRLLELSIRKLVYTPGFGVPKE